MKYGVPLAVAVVKNSKAVKEKAVAVTTFTPFTKMSAVAPFHLIAILAVSVVVVCKVVVAPLNLLDIIAREVASLVKINPFVNVESLPNPNLEIASLVLERLFLKSTNQVPPLAVISPLVKMLPLLITSAFLVTEAELVGM